MHIAVVIPAYNVAPFLGDAVSSVISQTHANWSLTIVDDGSDDDAEMVVARFPDPRVRYIRQPNAGVSAARNAGIQACLQPGTRNWTGRENSGQPDGFVFLDGDDWLAPHALSALAAGLESAPWAVAACGRYARVSSDGFIRLAPRPPHGCLLERLLTRNLFANGGHILIRQEAIEAAGAFRQDLSYGEDWEYWTRLASLGEFARIPSPAPPALALTAQWCRFLWSRRTTAIAASPRTIRTAFPGPILFVRERAGSALFSGGTDPAANRPALQAIYQNPAIAKRIGQSRLNDLSRRARAETAWAVGRELIRHGRQRDGHRWLWRSIAAAPSAPRVALMALAWLRCGPFRPHPAAGHQTFSSISPL